MQSGHTILLFSHLNMEQVGFSTQVLPCNNQYKPNQRTMLRHIPQNNPTSSLRRATTFN